MALVVFFLFFNGVLIAAFLHQRWRHFRDPAAHPLPRRLTAAQLYSFGFRQLFIVGFLALTWYDGAWTTASVGIDTGPGQLMSSILAGEVGFLGLMLAYALLMFVFRKVPMMRAAASRGNLSVWPRTLRHKILAGIFIMVFNPFTEELVMRGILIHQWTLLLGSATIPIIVGFMLNALLHAYQGWRMQLWHSMFFIVVVYLLFNWGLVAAITAHVFGDVAPILTLRRELRRVRAHRRSLRLARGAQAA